jgi:dTDP-4-dehydrorhamnose reductase
VVINCAGYTAVDQAEAEPELAWAVNAEGAEAVARACAQAGAHLVHLSTDYVFDGRGRRPYREDDPPAPLSAYGRSKLAGEERVRRVLPGALIVRSAWLFGPGRADFVDKVLARARQGRRVRVVADQVGSPTYTVDLARALVELGRRRVGGVLHVVNAGQASRYELARQAVRLAGLEVELVEPVSSREYVLPAARPAYSVLDSRRAARLLGGPLPTWLDALRRHLAGGGGEASA